MIQIPRTYSISNVSLFLFLPILLGADYRYSMILSSFKKYVRDTLFFLKYSTVQYFRISDINVRGAPSLATPPPTSSSSSFSFLRSL